MSQQWKKEEDPKTAGGYSKCPQLTGGVDGHPLTKAEVTF